MAMFIVRIELHDATQADYDELHRLMEAAGFSRTIRGTTGAEYRLPSAEYRLSGSFDSNTACVKAIQAARRISDDPRVLVTEASGMLWANLDPV